MHVYSPLRMQLALTSQKRFRFYQDSSPRFQIMVYVLIVLSRVGDPGDGREDDI